MRTVSRRTFLSTAPAAAVAVSGALPPSEWALNALYARWQRKEAEINGIADIEDEEGDRLTNEVCDIEREIFACPTDTLEGLRIKAKVAEQYLDPWSSTSIDDVAFRSVFEAIMALASA